MSSILRQIWFIPQPQPRPSSMISSTIITDKSNLIQLFLKDQIQHSTYNQALPSKLPKNNIRLVTYNVHYWTKPASSKLGDNVTEIFEVLKTINADILILQEVALGVISKSRLMTLLMSLGYPLSSIVFYAADQVHDGPFGNLIASKYPIVDHHPLPLFGLDSVILNESPQEKRCAIIVQIMLPDHRNIIVCGVHLDVYDQTEQVRLYQIRQILDHLNNINIPIVIAGDFNSLRRNDYTEFEWQQLVTQDEHRGVNTKILVTDELEAQDWRTSFDLANVPNPKYTTWSGRTIDFIYLNHWTYPIYGTYVYHSAASDHLPVILDFIPR